MSAKGPVHFANMYRRNHRLREQAKRRLVRSHGLRPESKAYLRTARFACDRVGVEGQALYPSHTTGRAVFRIRRLDCSALR
ncbi:hypothetical protein CN228_29605 [Pseudomonas syringae pv. actinidiae str. Shaanxi_M228]|nr:hypothetical protein CN228_29605 [Pseudomonas syringae pv. actinidiae str. Shaanxi_M228]